MVGQKKVMFSLLLDLSDDFFSGALDDSDDFAFRFFVAFFTREETYFDFIVMPSALEVGMGDEDIGREFFDDDVGVLFGDMIYGACVGLGYFFHILKKINRDFLLICDHRL